MAPNSENEIEISVTYWIGGKDSETYSQRFSGVETRKLGGGLTKQSKVCPIAPTMNADRSYFSL